MFARVFPVFHICEVTVNTLHSFITIIELLRYLIISFMLICPLNKLWND